MLKSTYKPISGSLVLADGWTEHKAPSGHSYYYHSATNHSTYTRPSIVTRPPPPPSPHILVASPSHGPFNHSLANQNEIRSFVNHQNRQPAIQQFGHGEHSRHRRGDRPKSKHAIPDCQPWLLVQTKLGRRFVYNPDEGVSLWKFPMHVMKGVIEYDRIEREKRSKAKDDDDTHETDPKVAAALAAPSEEVSIGASAPNTATPRSHEADVVNESDEYEEVEVTDDDIDHEDDQHSPKRQKTEGGEGGEPVEFDEDDIAYQLAAMGEDYGLDPGEYGNGEEGDLEEGAEGLGLTEEDSKALFKDMLNDFQISPYTTWEKIIEAGQIIEDDRYTVLPNMRSRKEVWDEWSRERIQQLRDQREKEEKKDPKVPYFAFLQAYATPKLYWPEFRRKYRTEPEMKNTRISDKDREKWYRDYISRLKLNEGTLKADLIKMLRSIPLNVLNKSSTINNLPAVLLTDTRYISLRPNVRDPLIEAHIGTLPPTPNDIQVFPEEQEARLKGRQDRERREKALADRQQQVQEEKMRQRRTLQYSKNLLREGEEEVQRALNIGKEGLLGHIDGE